MAVQIAKTRTEVSAPYSRLLNVFDQLAKEDPEELRVQVESWFTNTTKHLEARITGCFGPGEKIDAKELKKIIKSLNELE